MDTRSVESMTIMSMTTVKQQRQCVVEIRCSEKTCQRIGTKVLADAFENYYVRYIITLVDSRD